MTKEQTIKQSTVEQLNRYARLRLGGLSQALNCDDIIEWLLNIANNEK